MENIALGYLDSITTFGTLTGKGQMLLDEVTLSPICFKRFFIEKYQ